MPIRVAITDDHPLAIDGLRSMLASAAEIEVRNTYISGSELLDGLTREQPDVLLLDIQLPDKKGTELAGYISKNYPGIRIIALTSLDAPVYVKAMMREGCMGYVLKNTDKQSLIFAIEQVYRGLEYIEPEIKDRILYNVLHHRKAPDKKSPNLTHREKEILQLIVAEYTCQEIADKLYLSQRTVETHRFNLQKKLAVNNTIGLVKIAMQMGLLE